MDDTERDVPRDPQDLERLLVARQHAGDVDGMAALYEPGAIVDPGEGPLLVGLPAIRTHFEAVVASGRRFALGEQRPAVVVADVALTSTRFPDGSVSAEVARRQADGTWRWVIDRFAVT